MKELILSLSDPQATLESVGGKGMSLAKMINAGFPVPGGFHITTQAYRQFVTANNLQIKILAALQKVDVLFPASLETTCATIGKFFTDAFIPEEIMQAIQDAYLSLGESQLELPVAVRSSATAEDLPEASFAGQQETYLNIRGQTALLEAIKKCWASLWTARAIAYRIKNNIDQNTVALAIVVQEMVNAEFAGILFTANPINGRRDEMVINASWGLGEAIVGGLVSPDAILANKATGKVKTMQVAEKNVITVSTKEGTREQPLNDARRSAQVLNDAQVAELVGIARGIESFHGRPQDIEWCHAGERFFIVQSRPITALPEAPIEWAPPNPKGTYMRTSAADLMPAPLSPLFSTLGIPAQVEQMQPLGKRLLNAEPVLAPDYFTSINSYAYMNAAISPRSWWWILTGILPAYPRLLRRLVPLWRDELHPEYRAFVAGKKDLEPAGMPAGEIWHEIQELANAAAYYICGLMFATMGASAGSEMLFTKVYDRLARQDGDPDAPTLLMGWDNIPMRSEKSLYDIAMRVRQNDELAEYLLESPTTDLAAQISALLKGEMAGIRGFPEFAQRFQAHLEMFGHIVFQLDYAEALPLDHPEMLIETIKMYLRGEGANPYQRQQASQEKRIQTAETIRKRLKGFKCWAFQKTLKWAQSMAEIREDALAEIGLAYPKLRELLRALGSRLVTAGAIQQAEDIFWLEKDEISQCVSKLDAGQTLDGLARRVEARQAFNERIAQVTPPPMMPMKERILGIKTETFIAQTAEAQAGNTLKGVPASAGKVTAPARILRGPQDFAQMRPGEVLVAGTTTPAWTPLFAMASAVVTDIGGPLSHGSIVAREYGIPAVMGTGVATRRIQSGQVITVDGSKGEVILAKTEAGQTEQPTQPIEWPLPTPKTVCARGSLAEHLPNAVSPLFGTLGLRSINQATAELSELVRMDLLQADYQYRVINGYVYMGFIMTTKFMWGMIKTAFINLKLMLGQGTQRWLEARKLFANTVATWETKDLESLPALEILAGVRALMYAAGKYYTVIQSGTLPSASTSEMLFTSAYKLAKREGDPEASSLLFGLETVPLRAEKSLFDLGRWIRERSALREFTLRQSTSELAAALQARAAPYAVPAADWHEFQSRFNAHLEEFGRTSYEFDFMNPTPAETPEVLLDAIKVYVEGKGSDPYARQQAAAQKREQTVQAIQKRFKLIPNRWFNKALQWAIDTGPVREDSIADMGMGHTTLRRLLEELGKRLVANGALERAEDIYWLVGEEVEKLADMLEQGETLPDHSDQASRRKAEWRTQMKLNPPLMLPATSRWAKLVPGGRGESSGNMIKGLGASAGKVTGRARVLFSPEDFGRMQPGDVLVAVTTTPAWTPLFAMASAVVTDIGGPLSHSSIVAREYGIPAVLATGMGSRRIRDGQTITVDGGAGTVELK